MDAVFFVASVVSAVDAGVSAGALQSLVCRLLGREPDRCVEVQGRHRRELQLAGVWPDENVTTKTSLDNPAPLSYSPLSREEEKPNELRAVEAAPAFARHLSPAGDNPPRTVDNTDINDEACCSANTENVTQSLIDEGARSGLPGNVSPRMRARLRDCLATGLDPALVVHAIDTVAGYANPTWPAVLTMCRRWVENGITTPAAAMEDHQRRQQRWSAAYGDARLAPMSEDQFGRWLDQQRSVLKPGAILQHVRNQPSWWFVPGLTLARRLALASVLNKFNLSLNDLKIKESA